MTRFWPPCKGQFWFRILWTKYTQRNLSYVRSKRQSRHCHYFDFDLSYMWISWSGVAWKNNRSNQIFMISVISQMQSCGLEDSCTLVRIVCCFISIWMQCLYKKVKLLISNSNLLFPMIINFRSFSNYCPSYLSGIQIFGISFGIYDNFWKFWVNFQSL